jgi:hypothetical protein
MRLSVPTSVRRLGTVSVTVLMYATSARARLQAVAPEASPAVAVNGVEQLARRSGGVVCDRGDAPSVVLDEPHGATWWTPGVRPASWIDPAAAGRPVARSIQ